MRWTLALPLMAACAPTPIPEPIIVPSGGLDPGDGAFVVGSDAVGAASGTLATPPSGGTILVCDTGESIGVAYRDRDAMLTLADGRTLRLPRVDSPTGTRYAADGVIWFVEGSGGILTDRGGQQQCDQT